jgi:hypothetical protein
MKMKHTHTEFRTQHTHTQSNIISLSVLAIFYFKSSLFARVAFPPSNYGACFLLFRCFLYGQQITDLKCERRTELASWNTKILPLAAVLRSSTTFRAKICALCCNQIRLCAPTARLLNFCSKLFSHFLSRSKFKRRNLLL